MENEHQKQGEIDYSTTLKVDNREYFQSLAHQLARYLLKQNFSEYRFSVEFGFMDAKIYIETLISEANLFIGCRWSPKKCIGVLLFNIESNQMVLRKTGVDRTKHEFHADGELDNCFGVQYDVFKYLRDSDLIQIHTIENVGKDKKNFIYIINKMKALKNGRFLHFKGHGTQFFIPVDDFKKYEGKPYKKPRGGKNAKRK